jgi:hypothetical protein
MKTRVLRAIRVIFKVGRSRFWKLLSKLSHTIITLKSQIKKGSRKLGNKQENHLQEETKEVSRRIGEPTVDPQPTQPPSPLRLENELQQTEEISRRIGEPTVDPRPTQPPNPMRVRRVTEGKVDPRPKQPPNPIRLRKIGVATVNPRPKKTPRPPR